MTKIYGKDDITIAIENSDYEDTEIGCYESVVRFELTGGTVVAFVYMDGEWKIDLLRIGDAPYKIDRKENAFYSGAKIIRHEIIDECNYGFGWGSKDAVQE